MYHVSSVMTKMDQTTYFGYKKLLVWQEAHTLTLLIYKITKHFPKDELFGLTNQMRRAAVSVTANIVEGQARATKKEFHQFLFMSNGSLVEVEYYIELSKDLGYISEKEFTDLYQQRIKVGKLLHRLIKSLS